jgi:demethylmenaquinone methyltransferase/2-methoxy-6-polyprenyl-1,4-benzoquinol methylase
VKEYYDSRAREYDDWWLGRGLFADRDRPGWKEEVEMLTRLVSELPPVRTLDVACGTGFVTRHLRGDVVALDHSRRMLDEACRQALHATVVRGDALALPFPDRTFDRVFTSHFYSHLEGEDRERFLDEAARVAGELVVVDASQAYSGLVEDVQARVLNDGSEWTVYKRWFTGPGLAAELGGGEVLHEGHWFVMARAQR